MSLRGQLKNIGNSYFANDIMNFIIKITKKYKTDINANLIIQLDKEGEGNQIFIIKKLFYLLFDDMRKM